MSHGSASEDIEFTIVVVFVIIVVLAGCIGLYWDRTNPTYKQLVCKTKGVVTHTSAVIRYDRLYKNNDSGDYVIGTEHYTPSPGETCKTPYVEVKPKTL